MNNYVFFKPMAFTVSFVLQLHLKEKRRFDFADMDGKPGLNLTEFLAFTHPSEVDHMAVSHRFTVKTVNTILLCLFFYIWGCPFHDLLSF